MLNGTAVYGSSAFLSKSRFTPMSMEGGLSIMGDCHCSFAETRYFEVVVNKVLGFGHVRRYEEKNNILSLSTKTTFFYILLTIINQTVIMTLRIQTNISNICIE